MERLLSDMPPTVCVKVEDSFYKVISEISTRTFGALRFFHFEKEQSLENTSQNWGVGGHGDINVSYWSRTVVIFSAYNVQLYIEPPSSVDDMVFFLLPSSTKLSQVLKQFKNCVDLLSESIAHILWNDLRVL
jgi:hypothetical protein